MFAASKSGRVAAAAATTDPNFKYVPLLLNTTSTNGQQNNTFLDSSTNNFTITRNGTPTQGSITPYWTNGQWSNYFAANGDYLTAGSSTTLALGAGDFTIETWVYLTSYNTNSSCVFDYRTNGGSPSNIPALFIGPSGILALYTNIPSGTLITGSTAVSLNTWTHLAIVRSGTATSNVKMYLNGVSIGSGTTTSTLGIETFAINNAALSPANIYILNGYISNFRIVKGVAVYTGAFTPPTSPLTATQSAGTNISAITGTATSLLTCQSNRFKDNSTNAFAITVNGTPTVQAFQPFSPTESYTTALYGGSGYFVRASSQYLTVPNSASQFSFGTGALTIECWVNLSSLPSASGYPGNYWIFGGGPASNNPGIDFYLTPTQIGFNLSNFTSPTAIGNHGMVVNNWYHVAVVRGGPSNQTVSIYVNGTRVATASSVTDTADAASTGIAISAAEPSGATSGNFDGYIANYRVIKGTAFYDPTLTTLTVPTSPVTAVSGTQLLLNMTNAGIYDAAVQNNIITVGDAQASITVSKWSPTSMKFDGTGDWLTAIDGPQLQLGTGDFTIDGWVYLSANGIVYGLVSKGTATTGWSVNVTVLNKLQFSYTTSNLTGATSLSTGTWYYFAVVRSGSATGNLKVYLNGSVDATSGGAVTDNFNQTSILYVGADRIGASALNGYLQDVRITKAARTITTPTAAFPTR